MNIKPYGNTAARDHAKSGKETRPSSITIDAHCHLHVQEAADIVAGLFDPFDIPAFRHSNSITTNQNVQQLKDRFLDLTNIEQRLNKMDSQGIDMQVLIPVPFQHYCSIKSDVAFKAIQTINNKLSAAANNRPDRFVALGQLPMQNGDLAAKEMERSVKELDLRGFQIITFQDGKELSHPSYDPVWKMATELDIPIFLHPNGYPEGERLKNHYFINIIGNPMDTTVALHHLIFDGTMEKFPTLKIFVAHGGGYLPAYSGRIDHAWGARPDCRGYDLKHKPSDYLKRMYFDTVVFSFDQLKYLIDKFGSNHIIMGTDYPYDMAEDDPIEHVLGTDGLSQNDIKLITGGNACSLFKII